MLWKDDQCQPWGASEAPLRPIAYAGKNGNSLLRLCNLAILSIENKIAKSVDYTDVVDDFASMKARTVL